MVEEGMQWTRAVRSELRHPDNVSIVVYSKRSDTPAQRAHIGDRVDRWSGRYRRRSEGQCDNTEESGEFHECYLDAFRWQGFLPRDDYRYFGRGQSDLFAVTRCRPVQSLACHPFEVGCGMTPARYGPGGDESFGCQSADIAERLHQVAGPVVVQAFFEGSWRP